MTLATAYMSLNSERFDDDRSEQQDRFDEGANGDPDPRMLSLERFDGVLHPLGESTVVLPDSIRAGSPLRLGTRPLSRQTSRCSSRRSRQTEQCQRLSVISHHRTDEILSAIIDDELAVRNKFAGERRSGRDPTRRIEEVLYADAATIRSHLEQKRMQVRADSEAKANQAGATAESNRLLLRKLKRGLLQQFRGQSTDGILSRDGFEALLDLLGIVRRCRPGSRASRLRARFWSVVTGEPDCRLDGVTFAAFYRYGIVIAFPLLFRLLLHDRTELRPIEQQIVEEASMLPGRRTTDLAINVFDRGLDPHFLSGLGRSLIDNANLIRLLYPGRSQPTSSSDDELVFRPEITPRSESLARRQRQQSGANNWSKSAIGVD